MAHKIQIQTEKRGKVESDVRCKVIAGFYKPNGDWQPNPKRPVLRVLVENIETGAVSKLTWSNFHKQCLSGKNPGKFKYTQEDKELHPEIKLGKNRGTTPDVLTKKVLKKGSGFTKEWEQHQLFANWCVNKFGEQIATEIMTAFAERMAEFHQKQSEAA